MRKFKLFFSRVLRKCFAKFHRAYRYSYVEDFPDTFKPYTVYLQGKPGQEWLAGFLCPCGCTAHIELVLIGQSPKWKLTKLPKKKVTFYPSVFRNVGCKSHFFIKKGKVRWC